MDIKVGDRVKLKSSSEFYDIKAKKDSSNPIHCLGTYNGNGTVKWDNGKENGCYGTTTYDKSHLIFVKENKIHELWS